MYPKELGCWGLDSDGSGQDLIAVSSKYDNGIWGSRKGEKCLGFLCDYQLLKNDFAPRC